MVSTLDSATLLLARAALILEPRRDNEALTLAAAVRTVQGHIAQTRALGADAPRQLYSLIANESVAVNERVAAYCERNGLFFMRRDSTPTMRMRIEDFPPEVQAAIRANAEAIADDPSAATLPPEADTGILPLDDHDAGDGHL